MDEKAREELNARLADLSREIYGGQAWLRMVDPRTIRLLKRNARFMTKPVFDQLAANVASDGMLSSVPLCHEVADGTLEALSGNHRVKAAITANLPGILVLVLPEQGQSQAIAKQLSHNALVGEDDKQLLASLWKDLERLEDKLYSGLDSALVKELEGMQFAGFGAEPVRTERVTLWFLPEEVENLDALLAQCQDVALADHLYLAPLEKYQALWERLVHAKKARNIKNTAVAFWVLIDQLQPCAGSIESDAPADQAGEGGPQPSRRSYE